MRFELCYLKLLNIVCAIITECQLISFISEIILSFHDYTWNIFINALFFKSLKNIVENF